MNSELLHKLIELIVAEVVKRVAKLEREAKHPEQVLVLLAAPVAYPKELKKLLATQFGVGYTPLSFVEGCDLGEETVFAANLKQERLTELVSKAKTVILVGPRIELLSQIAHGNDRELLAYLAIRSVLWKKDVRLYLDFEPPRFHRNTFLEGVASSIDVLRQMEVAVCPYYTGDAAKEIGASLITEKDVLAAADSMDKTIHARVGVIITPAARDALRTHEVTVAYEGETPCN